MCPSGHLRDAFSVFLESAKADIGHFLAVTSVARRFSQHTLRTYALTVSVPVLVTPPSVAVIVTAVSELTTPGVTFKEALEEPLGTVITVPEGIVTPSELETLTAIPLGPAFPVRYTVTFPEVPPFTDAGTESV